MTEILFFERSAYQGDVFIVKIDEADLPANLTEVQRQDNKLIVAHSETGHHHSIFDKDASLFEDKSNPDTTYLKVGSSAQLVHERSYDTHPTMNLQPGVYAMHHQKEMSPEGWRRVMD